MLCGTRAISARSVGICDGVPSTARSSINCSYSLRKNLMLEIVELSETNNYYTVLWEKNIAGCQQTFWSGDNQLSPDLKVCWQPVVTRHFLIYRAFSRQKSVHALTVKIRKSQDFLAPISGSPCDQIFALTFRNSISVFLNDYGVKPPFLS